MIRTKHVMKYFSTFLLSCWIIMLSCNLEQEIIVELPEVDNPLVVECYLEPGKPFSLLMTRGSGYFDPFPNLNNDYLENLLVRGADVRITHKGNEYILKNTISFNVSTNKLFNYSGTDLVPEDYESPFFLNIVTEEGKAITSQTMILPPVPIDSVVIEFDEDMDTLARALTYFTDIPEQTNFYRRMLHKNSVVDSIPEQDFAVDDRVVEDVVVFGSSFEYEEGDTLYNTIFHITEDYYNFFESLQLAISGNLNPFAQPSPIISNVEGDANAIGIFTGLTYDRDTSIVEK